MLEEDHFFPELYDESMHPSVRVQMVDLRIRSNLLRLVSDDSDRDLLAAHIDAERRFLRTLPRDLPENQVSIYADLHALGEQAFRLMVSFAPEYPSEQ